MIELKTQEAVDVAMVPIFSVNGKVYEIPDKVRPGVAMKYLHYCRTRGIGIAESWLAEELLGVEGYEALLDFPDLTQEQSDAIITTARAVVFGEVRPKEKGNGRASGNAAPRKRSTSTKRANGS